MNSKILVVVLIFLSGMIKLSAQADNLEEYDIVWTDKSENSYASIPLVGGDIGCNVWVEKGELLFYMQRSGSFSENR